MSATSTEEQGWPPFTYQGATYDLAHLEPFPLLYTTSTDGVELTRNILVEFTDHCFTDKFGDGDDPDLLYVAREGRKEGSRFCFDRYKLSLTLSGHLKAMVDGNVYQVESDRYAVFRDIVHGGKQGFYAIYFTMDRWSRGYHLKMRVRSAFARPDRPYDYGKVRFKNLVDLRLKGVHPKKIQSRKRR